MKAFILSIGDELALGQTIDTNSAWMSQQLASIGCDVAGHMTVSDDKIAIRDAMTYLVGLCDVLIVSGGIGPTDDDLTRFALADAMGVELYLDEGWAKEVEGFFTRIGRVMPKQNQVQAMMPVGATSIFNTCGTAAGIRAKLKGKDVFVTPGVPKEMKAMFDRDIKPFVKTFAGGAAIVSSTLHTFGQGESTIAEKLGDLMNRSRNPSVGTTVSGGIVSLRVNSRFESVERATEELRKTEQQCEALLGDLIFGKEDQTLPMAIASLLTQGREKPLTVATAESCTGGLIAKMLTDLSGSSSYYMGGFVTYSNKSKYERLGVNMEMLNVYGAVSEQVVLQMARSARRLMSTTYGISVSGVAGPTGGSPTKPVGTVCIGLAYLEPGGGKTEDHVFSMARTFQLPGDRDMIRDRSAKMALTLLRFHLMQKPTPFQ
jgi:nicotinamide-nucleotide amidase